MISFTRNGRSVVIELGVGHPENYLWLIIDGRRFFPRRAHAWHDARRCEENGAGASTGAGSMTFPFTTSAFPTDNLYKFIAVAGLVGVVSMQVLISLAFNRQVESLNSMANANREMSRLYRAGMVAINAGGPAQASAQRQIDSGEAAIQRQQDVHAALQDHLEHERSTLRFLRFVFTLITAAGFSAWYVLVQRYHDALLHAEAKRVGFDPERRSKPRKKMQRIWRRASRA